MSEWVKARGGLLNMNTGARVWDTGNVMEVQHMGDKSSIEYRAGIRGFEEIKAWYNAKIAEIEAVNSRAQEPVYHWVADGDLPTNCLDVWVGTRDGQIVKGYYLIGWRLYIDNANAPHTTQGSDVIWWYDEAPEWPVQE